MKLDEPVDGRPAEPYLHPVPVELSKTCNETGH